MVPFETVFTPIARPPAIYRVETFERYYVSGARIEGDQPGGLIEPASGPAVTEIGCDT